MGFTLDAYFVLDEYALAAYGALMPGALNHVIAANAHTSKPVPRS